MELSINIAAGWELLYDSYGNTSHESFALVSEYRRENNDNITKMMCVKEVGKEPDMYIIIIYNADKVKEWLINKANKLTK